MRAIVGPVTAALIFEREITKSVICEEWIFNAESYIPDLTSPPLGQSVHGEHAPFNRTHSISTTGVVITSRKFYPVPGG